MKITLTIDVTEEQLKALALILDQDISDDISWWLETELETSLNDAVTEVRDAGEL